MVSSLWNKIKIPIYEKYKKKWLESHPKDIGEYSWDYLFEGGKQIRPNLFCDLWNYLCPDLEICGELAFAIECIHVSSLILDDSPWMDNASERRGKKTLHLMFSEKKALLICYDVMKIVYDIWLTYKPNTITNDIWILYITNKLELLTIGQWYDLSRKGNFIDLASLKTGILFELVTETVAICLDLDRDYWRVWGNSLGILFQWMDDWIDREEDLLQKNRNAFNENYNQTLQLYSYLWNKIINQIGKGWFKRNFGEYIQSYFTNKIPMTILHVSSSIHEIITTYSNPWKITKIIPSATFNKDKLITYSLEDLYELSKTVDRDLVISLMMIYSNKDIKIEPLKTNLWEIDENAWESVPELNYYFDYFKSLL
jgi:geranylgeranyl pyrophosphate synthase